MTSRIFPDMSYYTSIRSKLGVDSSTLPNQDIDDISILTVAEARVISRVPDYATLTGDNQAFLITSDVCMIASLLAPSMASRLKASEGDADYKYTNQQIDWNKRAKDLEDESYMYIDYISTQTIVELPQLGLAGPTRLNNQTNTGLISPSAGDISLYPTNVE